MNDSSLDSPLPLSEACGDSIPSGGDKKLRPSPYDPVVQYKLITNCSWVDACRECNIDPSKRASVISRYHAQRAYFDSFLALHAKRNVLVAGVSTANVLEKTSIRINQYLEYIGTMPLPKVVDFEFVRLDKEMASAVERWISVAAAIKSPDSPFVKEVESQGTEVF